MKQLRMQTIHDLADRSLLAKHEEPKNKESFKDGYLSGFFDAYAMFVKGANFEICPECGRMDNWGIGNNELECICNHIFKRGKS